MRKMWNLAIATHWLVTAVLFHEATYFLLANEERYRIQAERCFRQVGEALAAHRWLRDEFAGQKATQTESGTLLQLGERLDAYQLYRWLKEAAGGEDPATFFTPFLDGVDKVQDVEQRKQVAHILTKVAERLAIEVEYL